VVFVIDATDRTFLEATLSRLWSTMSPDSLNRRTIRPVARMLD